MTELNPAISQKQYVETVVRASSHHQTVQKSSVESQSLTPLNLLNVHTELRGMEHHEQYSAAMTSENFTREESNYISSQAMCLTDMDMNLIEHSEADSIQQPGPISVEELLGEGIIAESTPEVRSGVARETDNKDEEELPQIGFAKDLLSKFKNLEAEATVIKRKEYTPSGVGSLRSSAPPLPNVDMLDVSHSIGMQDPELISPGGIYESEPIVRTDIVKESQRNDEEELPPVGLTKNLLQAFKQRQTSGESTPVTRPLSRVTSNSSIAAESLSLYKESDGGFSENLPVFRDDVAREGDATIQMEQLPAQGTTKNLLGMFSEVSISTQKMTSNLHRPSGVAQKRWTPKTPRVPPVRAVTQAASAISAESKPDVEIAREDDGNNNEEELPKSGFAKGMLQKFKSMQSTDQKSSLYQQAWSASSVKCKSKTVSQKSEVRRVVVQNKTNVDIETLKLQEISAQEQNPDEEPLPSDSNQNNATVTWQLA